MIYDNDGEQINLAHSNDSPAPTTGGDQAAVKQQQEAGSMKAAARHTLVDAYNNKSSTNSFVHREHADETQEQQDNYATCLLMETLSEADHPPVNITKLAGRLNFWQPIENRGVAHMIARLRYSYDSEPRGTPLSDSSRQLLRRKRESFQTLIERAPPSMKDQSETPTMTRPAAMGNQLVHQVWLHDDDDCTGAIRVNGEPGKEQRKMVAELKAFVVNGTIDMDSELIVGHLNLTHTNSILDKCLRMNLLLANDENQTREIQVGHCKIVQSDSLPPVGELEQVASVASNIQPLREDLLVSGSSLSPATATQITKTAPSNRKALFELM